MYIHGNKAVSGWRFAWAPWLQGALRFHEIDTLFETMPDSVDARAKYWLPYMTGLQLGPADLLVGWSTGAVAAMRYAESHPVGGLVLVAPHHTDLGKLFERDSGWFDAPWQWDAIARHAPSLAVFHSYSDPFVPAEEFDHIISRSGATRCHVPAGGHFIHIATFPELLDYLLGVLT